MTLRRLSILQWFGIPVGGCVWFAEFLAGLGTTQAACNPAGSRWGIPLDAVELALMAAGIVVVAAAELASLAVFRATREVEEQGPPPEGRLHFFASAAIAGNAIFLVIILLTGIAAVLDRACHQA